MTLLPPGTMPDDLAGVLALHLSVGLVVGFLIGIAYFALLRHTVDRYVGDGPAGLSIALTVLRFAGIAVVLWLLVQWSGAALLAALCGITLAQFRMRRRSGAPR